MKGWLGLSWHFSLLKNPPGVITVEHGISKSDYLGLNLISVTYWKLCDFGGVSEPLGEALGSFAKA